jgi:hypothetical protein
VSPQKDEGTAGVAPASSADNGPLIVVVYAVMPDAKKKHPARRLRCLAFAKHNVSYVTPRLSSLSAANLFLKPLSYTGPDAGSA